MLPALPGNIFIWLAALLYGWWTGFRLLGITDLVVLFILAVASYVVDLLLGLGGARRYGAGRAGMTGALVGLFLGVLALGPLGILLGPIIGASLGELLYGRPPRAALRAGLGAGIGTLLASLVRFAIGISMFCYLIWQVVFQR